jgi:hypothetical protein
MPFSYRHGGAMRERHLNLFSTGGAGSQPSLLDSIRPKVGHENLSTFITFL